MSSGKIIDKLLNMVKSQPFIVLVVLVCIRECVSQNCVKVDTSEGRVTLRHGQSACAPLLDGETKRADQGKRFVICSYGYVFIQSCPGVLRFHAALGICQWPEFSDCNIRGLATDETQTTTSVTRKSPSTWLPTTATTTTSRTTLSPLMTTLFSKTASTTAAATTSSLTTASPTTKSPTTPKSTQATTTQATPIKASPTTSLKTISPTTVSLTTSPTKASTPTYLTTSSTTTSPETTLPTTASPTLATTKSPTYPTTQDISNLKATITTPNPSKTTVELSTDNLAHITRSTEITYGTKTKEPQIKTTTTSTTPINTTSKTTTWLGASTKAPSIAHSTTASSSASTADNGTPLDPNTVIPDDSEYVNQCNWDTCQLPQCFCYGASPNISIEDTPMFLLLTFDGPMTSELFNSYYEMLMVDNGNRLFNQNGCPFRSTVFLAGAGTDYNVVDTLARAGHEIASGTLTDALPIGGLDADYNDTVKEIDGLRKKVLQESKSQELYDSLVGFRAPSMRTTQDVQFQVLKDNQFLYDSSISNIEIYSARSPVWPYTMDFGVVQCPNPPCPSRNYSGLWEMPVNSWLGEDGQSCSYVDSCSVRVNGFTAEESDWYNLFKNNFEAHFYPAKAPMHISMRTSTPTENQQLEQAMVRWLEDTLSSYNNVWLVTHKMVIDWMRDPLTNSQMLAQKWGC